MHVQMYEYIQTYMVLLCVGINQILHVFTNHNVCVYKSRK